MYMAPEIINRQPYQGADADLFAFGVTLMVARLFAYPFNQADLTDDKYKQLVGSDSHLFWKGYKKSVKGLEEDFINLITSMLQYNPASRPTMADVIGHKWMRGETVTEAAFAQHCAEVMEKVKADRLAEQDSARMECATPTGVANRRGGNYYESFLFDTDFYMNHSFKPAVKQKVDVKTTQFLVNAKPLDIMPVLLDLIMEQDEKVVISDKSWKFKFEGKPDPTTSFDSEPKEK